MQNIFKLNENGTKFSLIGSGDTIFIKPITAENKLLIEFFFDDNGEALEAGTAVINYGEEIAISEAEAIEVVRPATVDENIKLIEAELAETLENFRRTEQQIKEVTDKVTALTERANEIKNKLEN